MAEDGAVVLGRHREVEELVGAHAPLLVDVVEMRGEALVGTLVFECALHVREPLRELGYFF